MVEGKDVLLVKEDRGKRRDAKRMFDGGPSGSTRGVPYTLVMTVAVDTGIPKVWSSVNKGLTNSVVSATVLPGICTLTLHHEASVACGDGLGPKVTACIDRGEGERVDGVEASPERFDISDCH